MLTLKLAGAGTVAVAPSVAMEAPELLAALGGRGALADDVDHVGVTGATVGLTTGEAFVVETGSVLVSEHGLGDRAVSMLSSHLVMVVLLEAVVHTLDDVAALLSQHAGAGYRALVTGPSRTADIERSLTIGVQGPSSLHVILTEGKGA